MPIITGFLPRDRRKSPPSWVIQYQKCCLSQELRVCICVFLTPAGSQCWEATCFLCIWSWGNERWCPCSVTFLPLLSTWWLSSCIPKARASPHWVVTAIHVPVQRHRFQLPNCHLLVDLQITQPLGKCPSPYTVGPSHTPKHPGEISQQVQNFTSTLSHYFFYRESGQVSLSLYLVKGLWRPDWGFPRSNFC